MYEEKPPSYDDKGSHYVKTKDTVENGPPSQCSISRLYVIDRWRCTNLDAAVADEKHQFDVADLDRVQRRLKQRHIQM